jgi:hypothetical protein
MISAISKTKKKSSTTSSIKYLRLPLDQDTLELIKSVQSDNPFLSELEVMRYILGKFAIQNSYNSPKAKLIRLFDELKQKHLNTSKLKEEEVFKILEENDLI